MMIISSGNLMLTYPEKVNDPILVLVMSWAVRLTCLYSAMKTLEGRMLLKNITIILNLDWSGEPTAEMLVLHLQSILKALH